MHLFPTSLFWSSDGLSLALRTVMVADGLGTDGFLGGCTCRIFNIELRAFNFNNCYVFWCALEEGNKSGLSGRGNLFTKAYNNCY